MALQQVTDHAAMAQERMLAQFRDKTKIQALTGLLVRQVQDLEYATFEVIKKRLFDHLSASAKATAAGKRIPVGDQLTTIGKIVGQPRNGMTDKQLERFIKARILINQSDGTAEDVIEVAALVIGESDGESSLDYEAWEYYPAHLEIQMHTQFVEHLPSTVTLLRSASCGGARFLFVYRTHDDEGAAPANEEHNTFAFNATHGTVGNGEYLGFDHHQPLEGVTTGKLAGVAE